jgi:hypothetical protein
MKSSQDNYSACCPVSWFHRLASNENAGLPRPGLGSLTVPEPLFALLFAGGRTTLCAFVSGGRHSKTEAYHLCITSQNEDTSVPTLSGVGKGWGFLLFMPRRLKRYHGRGDLHFITLRAVGNSTQPGSRAWSGSNLREKNGEEKKAHPLPKPQRVGHPR